MEIGNHSNGTLKQNFVKGDEMKEQANTTVKDSGWLRYLLSPVIVGFIVLLGQSYIAPKVAREVKREESILEQRYKACESAINILQRRLASIRFSGEDVPKDYIPPEKKPPTQVEWNTAYTMLVIYGDSNDISEKFFAASAPGKTTPKDIKDFIYAVRHEIGLCKKDINGPSLHYIIIQPKDNNDPNDIKASDESKQ